MMTVTFSDMIQIGILIVGIIALCKKSQNKLRPPNKRLTVQTFRD